VIKEYVQIMQAYSVPQFLRGIVSWILKMSGQLRTSIQFGLVGNKSFKNFTQNSFNKIIIQERLHKYIEEKGYDSIISPVFPIPAFKHSDFGRIGMSFFYCAIWNFYEFPACVIPRVHIVEPEDTDPNDYIDTGIRLGKFDHNGKPNAIISRTR